jgi:periplasmic protein TonB
MRMQWLDSWAAAGLLTVATHALLLTAQWRSQAPEAPLEVVAFELLEVEVAPIPEPEPPPLPPGPKNPEPDADPTRTSAVSNRPPPPNPKPVPLRTGLPLTADQLVEGGLAVRVGNTSTPGFDADPGPEALTGFEGGGAGGGAGQVVVAVDQPPKLLRAYQPLYPPSLLSQGIEGRVLLRVDVSATGRATGSMVVAGIHPELDQLAQRALKRCRWQPARREGKRVPSTTQVSFRFQINR